MHVEESIDLPLCCVTGVCGVCGRDEFGVTGTLGVKGFAAGLSVYFLGALCCFSVADDDSLFVFMICYNINIKEYSKN